MWQLWTDGTIVKNEEIKAVLVQPIDQLLKRKNTHKELDQKKKTINFLSEKSDWQCKLIDSYLPHDLHVCCFFAGVIFPQKE